MGREGRASARSLLVSFFKGGLKPALLFVLAAWRVAAAVDGVEIRWHADARHPAVEVSGVTSDTLAAFAATEEHTKFLAVFAEQGSAKNMPPMSGRWQVAGAHLRFGAQFPFVRGVRYRAEFRRAGATEPLVSFFEMPADTSPPTRVAQVYPSAEVLPENQLKFYVHFSAPMSRRGIYEHVRICDAAGKPVELAFLELDEELWDPSMTRLTLLIDPGRIKRGVKPLEDIGPVFEAGKEYALAIDPELPDATGRPLGAGFEKRFRVGPADRTPPDPKRWKILPPAVGTRDPLVVAFDEPIDHALALRLITVATASKPVEGTPRLEDHERRWEFTSAQPWSEGSYLLRIATTIEDLAGNNIGKTFDVDLFEGVQRKIETTVVSAPFQVKASR